ncbi:MAG: hypothetical protein RQ751_07550 [Longimicrobiales bacterium]|nr:hypothetical protein [Longimicrobiales bacterium]
MRKALKAVFALAFLGFVPAGASAQMQMQMAETEEVEITGTVVDLSCKLVYNLTGDDHRMCSQVCADNGIPLGIVTDDGQFYLPVTAAMPGSGSNEMLRPHAEHKVTVKGKVVKRAGMPSIIIDNISMAQ